MGMTHSGNNCCAADVVCSPAAVHGISAAGFDVTIIVQASRAGKMWSWAVEAGADVGGAGGMMMMVSARLPCEHFRVWVVRWVLVCRRC
jgi:hypothetical protein